jgi:hypothetical protein
MPDMKTDESEPLTCAKKEKFAQLVASGVSFSAAYSQAGYKPNRGNATRMKANESIQARVSFLQKNTANRAQITKDDLVNFLNDAINTPLVDIDENSPLAQEVTRDYIGSEEEKQVIRKRIKSVGKMDAAKLLTTLLGWNQPERMEQKIEIVITKTW